MPAQKQFTAKIYDSDGSTFIANIAADTIKNLPTFRSRINGGMGECVLDFNFPFDDFNTTALAFMNVVKLYAVKLEAGVQSEDLIYSGFMSQIDPYISGNTAGVRVTCLGLGSLLTLSYYKDADYTVVHAAQDPETIARAIIDHFNTVYSGSLLSYSNDTTDAVGTNVSITFTDQKWFDALKKTAELAGTDWWWKIDESGLFWLKAKPGSATHSFTIGKDIESLSAKKDTERVVNDAEVRWSAGTATATDATSITAYGRRTKIISDASLTSSAAGSQRANKEVNDGKDPKIKAQLTINTKYDIESIKVGETCLIQNLDADNTFFNSNMLIVSVGYEGERVRLELEQIDNDIGLALDTFVNG